MKSFMQCFVDGSIRIHTVIPVFSVRFLDVWLLRFLLTTKSSTTIAVVDLNDICSLNSSLGVRENIWVPWSDEKHLLKNVLQAVAFVLSLFSGVFFFHGTRLPIWKEF